MIRYFYNFFLSSSALLCRCRNKCWMIRSVRCDVDSFNNIKQRIWWSSLAIVSTISPHFFLFRSQSIHTYIRGQIELLDIWERDMLYDARTALDTTYYVLRVLFGIRYGSEKHMEPYQWDSHIDENGGVFYSTVRAVLFTTNYLPIATYNSNFLILKSVLYWKEIDQSILRHFAFCVCVYVYDSTEEKKRRENVWKWYFRNQIDVWCSVKTTATAKAYYFVLDDIHF